MSKILFQNLVSEFQISRNISVSGPALATTITKLWKSYWEENFCLSLLKLTEKFYFGFFIFCEIFKRVRDILKLIYSRLISLNIQIGLLLTVI